MPRAPAAFALPALLLGLPARAATVRVDPAGGDAASIAEADPRLADGDTLELSAGEHTGCLRLDGRSLQIVGAGRDLSTWTGGDCAEQLRARDGEDLVLEGLTLRHPGGRAIALLGGSLTARDLRVADSGDPAQDGGGLWARGADLVLEDVHFDGNVGRLGAGLYPWDGGSLWLSGCSFTGNHAIEQGGGLYANGGVEGQIEGCAFTDNTSDDVSGALGWHLGTLELRASTFDGNAAASHGGAVYAHHATAPVRLSDLRFTGNRSGERGGAMAGAYGSRFELQRVTFDGNSAAEGADLALFDGELDLRDATSTGAAATAGGLLWLTALGRAELRRVSVCASDAPGALAWSDGELIVRSGAAADLGAAAVVVDGGSADLAFVGAWGLAAPLLDRRAGSASVTDSALVDVLGPALTGDPAHARLLLSAVPEPGVALADGDLDADPRWAGPAAACGLGPLLPAADSPLIDAGDPAALDPDGSRADLGPWGGPDSPMADLDGDGHWTVQDCDDADPAAHPGAPDPAEDGIDQDCDGEDGGAAGDSADPDSGGGGADGGPADGGGADGGGPDDGGSTPEGAAPAGEPDREKAACAAVSAAPSPLLLLGALLPALRRARRRAR
jgi:predicted outer membrane repeat protein